MVEYFYLSVASGSQRKTAKLMNYPYILINFMTQSNTPIKCEKLFIDCGGFPSSLISNGYNRFDEEYLEYVEKSGADYFALRDYPCEPQILSTHNVTVKEQINRTFDHHLQLLKKLDEWNIKAKPVPVLQGWEIEDYLYCIDLFKDHDLIFDYMAIGSVCRRHAVRDIRSVILAIKDELPQVRLHAFGVKLSVLRDIATWDAVHSVDSSAWDFDARWKRYRGDLTIPEASKIVAEKYLKKIADLRRFASEQTRLNTKW